MARVQYEDISVDYWRKGAKDEWYEYRVVKYDTSGRSVTSKFVLIQADNISRYYIDNINLAKIIMYNFKSGDKIILKPSLPFTVEHIIDFNEIVA